MKQNNEITALERIAVTAGGGGGGASIYFTAVKASESDKEMPQTQASSYYSFFPLSSTGFKISIAHKNFNSEN